MTETPVLPSDRSLGERSALGVPFSAEVTGASLGFTPVLLLKGNLARDLFPGVIPPSIPLLWDPEPTVL